MVGLIRVFLVATIGFFGGMPILLLLVKFGVPHLVSALLASAFGVILILRVMKWLERAR